MAKPTCKHKPPPGWEPIPWRHFDKGQVWRRARRCPTHLLDQNKQCGANGGPNFPHYCRYHSLSVEVSRTAKCRQCVVISKAETERQRQARREAKAAALEGAREVRAKRRESWTPPAGAAEVAKVTATEREKRRNACEAELLAMADGQLAALDLLLQAAEALRSDLTPENVARVLAAKPESVDLSRVRRLQQPEPIRLSDPFYTAGTVGEAIGLCFRAAFRFLGFEDYGMFRRALRGYFRKVAPG